MLKAESGLLNHEHVITSQASQSGGLVLGVNGEKGLYLSKSSDFASDMGCAVT